MRLTALVPSLLSKITYRYFGPEFVDSAIQATMLLQDLQNILSDCNITEDGLFLLLPI